MTVVTPPEVGRTGLDALLEPGAVTVVGASDDPERIGGRVLDHLRRHFTGELYPVNPRRATVQGLPASPTVAAVPGPVDLAVIAVAADAVPGTLEECAEKGSGAAIVISSGFAETGDPDGRELQDRAAAIARQSGMRLLGPNSMGSINLRSGVHATFAKLRGFPLDAGAVAIVSQSGAFGLRVFEGALTEGIGVSQMVLTGNEADVTLAEVALHLVERDEVRALALFVEAIRDPDTWLRLGRRAAEIDTPVVALKAGVSDVGAHAAMSHTGAMTVGSRAFDAAMESAGILTVTSLRDLLTTVKVLAVGARRPAGPRVCVLTASGGAGILLSDHLRDAGLELPPPSEGLRARVTEVLPPFGSAGNPVDYTGQIVNDPSAMPRLLEAVAASGEYDVLCFTGITRAVPRLVIDSIVEAAARSDVPFVAWAPQAEVVYEMSRNGVPAALDLQAMAAAIAGSLDREQRRGLALRSSPDGRPARAAAVPDGRRHTLTEARTTRLLARHGVPVTREGLATTRDEALGLAEEIGLPVALKLSAAWLAHKSDVGGVRLGLASVEDVVDAFDDLAAAGRRLRPDGGEPAAVLVQEMVSGDLEVMCGVVRDPTFGPVVTVGAGGVLAEIIDEQQAALAPLDVDHARTLVTRLWAGRLVDHPRGLSSGAVDALARLVHDVASLAVQETGVLELDLNPVVVRGDRVVAVDALAVVSEGFADE